MYFIPLYFSKIFHVAGLANISSCESNTVSGVVAITDTATVDICVPVSWNVWERVSLGYMLILRKRIVSSCLQ